MFVVEDVNHTKSIGGMPQMGVNGRNHDRWRSSPRRRIFGTCGESVTLGRFLARCSGMPHRILKRMSESESCIMTLLTVKSRVKFYSIFWS